MASRACETTLVVGGILISNFLLTRLKLLLARSTVLRWVDSSTVMANQIISLKSESFVQLKGEQKYTWLQKIFRTTHRPMQYCTNKVIRMRRLRSHNTYYHTINGILTSGLLHEVQIKHSSCQWRSRTMMSLDPGPIDCTHSSHTLATALL